LTAESRTEINGQNIPVRAVNTVIVGAGAAGMNCAVQLVQQWRAVGVDSPQDKVLVVTGGLALGASRMSGSDKQTYYKMGTSPRVPDTAADFAVTLTAFGCCHGDNALIEGICSLRGFYHLVEVGVPFPRDPDGAFIGYKTDHDPCERATSAGPKTSKFMSECLQAKAERLGVQIIDKQVVADFITAGRGPEKRIVAMVCIDGSRAGGRDMGMSAFVAENWVLAAGGPGEIYKATVYPPGQVGIHGAALKAGLAAVNLTESQYGLASVKFRWNVSGTYMQVVPRIFSTDRRGGDEREFLTEYFDDMPTMATSIFLKGYQWPFDAQRITDHQSSLIDMAVHQETVVRGRRVWMDFLRNPVGPSTVSASSQQAGSGRWDEFRIDALGPEALEYLEKTGATQELPIDRLAHMNQPAIDIYAENDIDLGAEPLEIAVCAQHMNGGFAVDKWWRSGIGRTFVIGEMAGTHGVKRPGGSALNAGQVGATRAAEYIANASAGRMPDTEQPAVQQGLAAAVGRLKSMFAKDAAAVTPAEAMDEIRDRMTRYGAHLRSIAGASAALKAAKEQYARLLDRGLKISGPSRLAAAVQAVQQCLTHLAVLKAICAMFERGAGSRGSHCILDESGVEMHPALIDPQSGQPYRFKQENESLRGEILQLTCNPDAPDLFDVDILEPRAIPDRDIAFEVAWGQFRDGKIYEL
jgi:succinate dehydrogenase/fumarate reductase flavoprotein subunit